MADGLPTAHPGGTTFWGAVYRFPIPLLAALFLTALNWHLLNTGGDAILTPNVPRPLAEAVYNLGPFLVAVFLYSFAIALYGEATGRRRASFAALVTGIGILFFSYSAYRGFSLLFWPSHAELAPGVVTRPGLFPFFRADIALNLVVAALVILPFVAPYLRHQANPGAFWQFAHKLTVAFLSAGIGGALAWGGIAAIGATAALLFKIDVPTLFYSQAANIAGCLGVPVILLALAPADFEELPRTGEAREFTSLSVSLLVRYIFIPLASILSLMLAAYIVLVLSSGKFETARLGLRGLLYGSGIIITALLAYPDVQDSRLARIFMRLWPWLLIPPTVLLFPSIWIRISEYGWTPFRYLVFAAGVWMALLALIGIRWRFELRAIPSLLALILILAAVGPWSVTEVTGRSQTNHLEAFLTSEGKLANGKWQATSPPGWPFKAQQRIISAVSALDQTNQLNRLEPWFSGVPDNPFTNPGSIRENLNRKLNVGFYPSGSPSANPQTLITFTTPIPRVFRISSEGYLYGPITRHSFSPGAGPQLLDTPIGSLSVTLKGTIIEVHTLSDKDVAFDVAPLLAEAKNSPKASISADSGTTLKEPVMRVLSAEGSLKAQLVVARLSHNVTSGGVTAEFFLILPLSPDK